ncbi:hypothetical protein GCM10010207_72310 [Streptomyces atratus]|uniref:hypothetical protein n=1 Tax=Streptomyces atratus TaxID=1893 RepID=UPI0016700273|nr:hypothetical protein [Streptomyces atratus]GGT62247.1 hypothetical protein GCM10010207_72310 [Streptomyces atratus]
MLLACLLVNLLLGWSRAGPTTTIVVIAVKEGHDAWQSKGCRAPSTSPDAHCRRGIRALRLPPRMRLTAPELPSPDTHNAQGMKIELLVVPDCPNPRLAADRLRRTLDGPGCMT